MKLVKNMLLSKEQIEDLLEYLNVDKVGVWKGNRITFCCPIHGESNPSCGINLDYSPEEDLSKHFQVFNCFACSASGTLAKFVYLTLPDQFRNIFEAEDFLSERYNVNFDFTQKDFEIHVKRYGDRKYKKERRVASKVELAPYRSGKETYKYFFNRGFTKEEMKTYMVGRDLEHKTVTVPLFWGDGSLAGVIGRYINPRQAKNNRFRVYEFSKKELIYPLDKVEPCEGTLIGVESLFDVIMLRKWGHLNVVCTCGIEMSKEQARQIKGLCNKYVALYDNDEGGREAIRTAKKMLRGSVSVLVPTYYPVKGKDPMEWGEVETLKVINSAKGITVVRYD